MTTTTTTHQLIGYGTSAAGAVNDARSRASLIAGTGLNGELLAYDEPQLDEAYYTAGRLTYRAAVRAHFERRAQPAACPLCGSAATWHRCLAAEL